MFELVIVFVMYCTGIPSDKGFRDEVYFRNANQGGQSPQATDVYQEVCVNLSLVGCPLRDARAESDWTALPFYSLNVRRINI